MSLTAEGDMLSDLPPCDVVGRICSERLMSVIQPFTHDILWLAVSLQHADQTLTYFFMHFLHFPDVLDETRTTYAGDRVVEPVLSAQKVGDRFVICLRPLANSAIVRNEAREAILSAGCVEIDFELVQVTQG